MLRYLIISLLIIFIGVINTPIDFYGGDSYAIQLTSINLLSTHSFGIDFKNKELIADTLVNKNQFLYENNTRQKYYSRWPFMNTIIFAVPLIAIDDSLHQKLIYRDGRYSLYHSLFNIFLTVILACYLSLIARLYFNSKLVETLFILTTLYATFMWNYLLAHSTEILQIVSCLGFYFHFIKYLRTLSKNKLLEYTPSYSFILKKDTLHHYFHLLMYGLFLFLLVHVKTVFVIFFPIVFLGIIITSQVSIPSVNQKVNLFAKKILYLEIYPCLLFILWLGIYLITNKIFFESSWSFFKDFHAARPTTDNLSTIWTIRNILPRLYDYLLSTNFSIFIHYPLLIFALPYLKKFSSKHPLDSFFLLSFFFSIFIVILFFYGRGEACYGPRFLLAVLPLLSLPLLFFLNDFRVASFSLCADLKEGVTIKNLQKSLKTMAISCIFLFIMLISFKMQMYVNNYPFKSKDFLQAIFLKVSNNNKKINSYFDEQNNALILKEAEDFITKFSAWFPIQILLEESKDNKYILQQKVLWLRKSIINLKRPGVIKTLSSLLKK